MLADRAIIFVDGRYTLQVRDQVDLDIFSIESLIDNPPAEWIKANLGKGARIGFDPWLHTIGDVKALTRRPRKNPAPSWCRWHANPIDELWQDRPKPPLGAVEIHPIAFAGELAKDKLARLAAAIAKDGATHAVLTDPSSHRLDLQHPRRRRAAYAAGARLRRARRRRAAPAFHGQAQAADHGPRPI